MTNRVLTIDPEFEAKCPSLTPEELTQLEENILEEGIILMPLIIWNNTIVDGHNRYKIAQKHPGIEFRTHEKQFGNRYEALSWICKNQLGRRNLTPMQKKYLTGQRYAAEKTALSLRGNQHTLPGESACDQIGHKQNTVRTRKRIAEETNTSEGYVERADQYAKGVDAAEEALPGIKNDLLSGKYKPKESDVAAIAKADPEERREKAEQLRVVPEKKPKESHEGSHQRRRQDLAEIDQIYEELKEPKRVTEDSALESLRYTARNMMETCDVLFEHFPGLLSKPVYKTQVVEIMQQPKQYILKLEGDSGK